MGKVQILAVLTINGMLFLQSYIIKHIRICALTAAVLDEIRKNALYSKPQTIPFSMLE